MMTTMPTLFAADASLANITATIITTIEPTACSTRSEDDEKTAPRERRRNKSRHFLRQRPGLARSRDPIDLIFRQIHPL
jgi:hypothetical protein